MPDQRRIKQVLTLAIVLAVALLIVRIAAIHPGGLLLATRQAVPLTPTPSRASTTSTLIEWNPYSPLRDSGWVNLSPMYQCPELRTVAGLPSEGIVAMGSCVLFHQTGHQPEWWQLATTDCQQDCYRQWPIWGVAPLSDDTGWAVGMFGWLAYYEGNHLQIVDSPTQNHLWDIQMLSSDNGWIVGENGTILRYDGTRWVIVPSPNTQTLYALSMVSPKEGWAVGRDGAIVHYNGAKWEPTDSPTREHLRGMVMVSETEGWAVGAHGTLLHYASGHWHSEQSPTQKDLHAVSMLSTSDGWAVGDDGTHLHYDGRNWASGPQLTEETLWDVRLISPQEGWAVGYRTILRYQDGNWRIISPVLPVNSYLTAVDFVSPDEGWVASAGGPDGGVWHSDHGQWRKAVTLTWLVRGFVSLDMLDGHDGWLQGSRETWHFTGQQWQTVTLPAGFLATDMQMVSPNLGWVVGNSIAQFKDGAWLSISNPTTETLWALSLLSAEEGWAVGDHVILRLHAGRWEIEENRPEKSLRHIDMVSDTDGWISADECSSSDISLLHYENGHWMRVLVPHEPSTDIICGGTIRMVSPDEGWMVGNAIFHYQGGQWQQVTDRISPNLQDIDMISPDEGWAVGQEGDYGMILHYKR